VGRQEWSAMNLGSSLCIFYAPNHTLLLTCSSVFQIKNSWSMFGFLWQKRLGYFTQNGGSCACLGRRK